MNRDDWLKIRRTGIGGSDIAAVLGLSPWRTPVDVWLDKTGRAEETPATLQMEVGTYLEDFVAKRYTMIEGRRVQRFNAVIRHPERSWMLGSIDRLVIPESQKTASFRQEIRTDRLLECKTASAHSVSEWGEPGSDFVPQHYLVQVAWYLACTGCEVGDLAVLIGNNDFRVYHIQRDRDLERMLIAKCGEFWHEHVLSGVAPEPVCEDDVKALFPRDDGSSIEANPKTLELLARAESLSAQLDSLTAELKGDTKRGVMGVEGELKQFMGEASSIVLDGQTLATWKRAKDSVSPDWETIARTFLQPDALDTAVEQYKTIKPGSRRFLRKEMK